MQTIKNIKWMLPVLAHTEIASETYRLTLDSSSIDEEILPGTFFNLTVPDRRFILKRPISVFAVEKDKSQLVFIYKIMGQGTKSLTSLKVGEEICVLGPLGSGFPIQDESETILLIGGGVGVPPLYELGCRLKAKGKKVVSVLGFKNQASVFCEAEFKQLGRTIICTDDGSYGFAGLVTQAIEAEMINFDTLYACGPRPMLKAVDLRWRDEKKGYLSFEERMACGIGACYGCMTDTKDGLKRVCKEGPVFRLGEVRYD